VLLWLRRIFSFRGLFHRLCAASAIDSASLARARRRLIHLPWFAAAICGVAWFLCIPVFIGALLQVQNPLDPRLLWHLPISFCVSGFIAVTHSFFLVELASYWDCFPPSLKASVPTWSRAFSPCSCGAGGSCGRFP